MINLVITFVMYKFEESIAKGPVLSDYLLAYDIRLVCELLDFSVQKLADELGISVMTLNRWLANPMQASAKNLEAFYSFAYRCGVRANKIKAQLYGQKIAGGSSAGQKLSGSAPAGREPAFASTARLLFHGSKSGLEGPLSLNASRKNNDFGQGFYCGENLEQSALFVCQYPQSSLYMLAFDPEGFRGETYGLDTDWMLTIASFRGTLGPFANDKRIVELRKRVECADFAIAPIADNRMFEVLDAFAAGEITDVQCQQMLSATDLGMQHVFLSEAALGSVRILEHCYLCAAEKARYQEANAERSRVGLDKAKIARREFRGQGRYVDELLGEEVSSHEGLQ